MGEMLSPEEFYRQQSAETERTGVGFTAEELIARRDSEWRSRLDVVEAMLRRLCDVADGLAGAVDSEFETHRNPNPTKTERVVIAEARALTETASAPPKETT